MSAKNYYEEPGSTLDRCPQRAERNFPCERKSFQLRWLGGSRKRQRKLEKDYREGKKQASAVLACGRVLGTSVNYCMEEEFLLGAGPSFPPLLSLAWSEILGLQDPSGVLSCILAPES